ncbi:MAG: SGNH/GDSL hydrolase family protein [Clostridia bacterium]|nr:SGNH/GDSL hydrolase family protein [Clostridia bacterium]
MAKGKLFVLGDSISIHYGPYLRDMIEARFEYDRKRGAGEALADLDKPTGANGGDSAQVLAYLLDEEKRETKYDILLLNCGLHDLRIDNASGACQVDINRYAENLVRIIDIAKKMAKRILWVESTPVRDEIHNRISRDMTRHYSDVVEYNRAAGSIMESGGIQVIPLFDFTDGLGAGAFCDHAHFTEDVRRLQAAFIAGAILTCCQ